MTLEASTSRLAGGEIQEPGLPPDSQNIAPSKYVSISEVPSVQAPNTNQLLESALMGSQVPTGPTSLARRSTVEDDEWRTSLKATQ